MCFAIVVVVAADTLAKILHYILYDDDVCSYDHVFFAVIFQILIYRTLILMRAILVLSVLIIGAAFGS